MKIPRYNAQVELTKQAPGVMVDASAAGQQARAMGEIGQVLSGIGEKMQAIKTSVQEDEGKIVATKLMNDAKFNADKEDWSPEYETNRQKEIDSIRKSTLDSVKDPQARQNVGTWLELNLAQMGGSFKYTGYNKLIQYKKDTATIAISHIQDRVVEGSFSEEIGLKEISNILIDLEKQGFMTEPEIEIKFKEVKEDLANKQVTYDMKIDPEGTLIRLNKGLYENLPADKRIDFIEKTQKIIDKKEKDTKILDKQNKINNETNLVFNIAEGKVNVEDISEIEKSIKSESIRPELAASAIRAILKPIDKDDMKENNEAFVKLAESVFSSDNSEKINSTLKDILDGFNQTDLSRRNMTLLIQTAKKIGEKKADVRKRVELFRSNYHRVAGWADENNVDKAMMIKSYAEGINKELSPKEAADIAIENGIKNIDPSFEKKDSEEKVQMIKEGETILNIKTGERMQMIGGRWVQIQ